VTDEPTGIREATAERRRALRDEAMAIMAREYASRLRLNEVARRIGASTRGLQRALAEGGDGSFTQALRTTRLETAAQLLTSSGLPINEVARNVGYASAEHFTRAFRQHYGLAPRAYRRAYRARSGDATREEPSPGRRAA
jgi:transcriptional regulator GlxA family with amidase domain